MELIPSCFELRVSYNWQPTASKPSPRRFMFSFRHVLDFWHNNCGCGTYSQATLEVMKACITGCDELARSYMYMYTTCAFTRDAFKFLKLANQTWYGDETRSVDFSCQNAKGSRSSWLQTLGNQLINCSPYIRYTNRKCYWLYYFILYCWWVSSERTRSITLTFCVNRSSFSTFSINLVYLKII